MVNENTYTLEEKIECCGKKMIIVIIKGKSACVMSDFEYNRIIEDERKFKQRNKLEKLA